MKKVLSVLVSFCAVGLCLFAEDSGGLRKNEIRFKAGMLPAVEFFAGVFTSAFSSIGDESDSDGGVKTLPSFTAEYLRSLSPRNAVGASVSFGMPAFSRVTRNGRDELNRLVYTAVQFKYRFVYMDKTAVKLYGGAGLGGELFISSANGSRSVTPFVAFQLVPIGISFGGERFFGTAEVAAGSEGSLLVLGAGLRF